MKEMGAGGRAFRMRIADCGMRIEKTLPVAIEGVGCRIERDPKGAGFEVRGGQPNPWMIFCWIPDLGI